MAVAPGDTRFEVAGYLTGNHIGGRWVVAQSGQRRADVNPADFSDVLGEIAESGGADADLAVEEARRALDHWRGVGPIARAALAGCTAVLKPSPLTPLTSALLVDVFREAGLPDGVLNLVQGDAAAGEALVANPAVAGISFTGSLPVGTSIHTGGAHRLLRTQLELGGKNAVVVCDDADLGKAVDAVVHGAFGRAGQRCSATSRVVVDVRVREEFLERLVARVAHLRVGPGFDEASELCPLVDTACLDAALAATAGGDGWVGFGHGESHPRRSGKG